MPNDATQQRGRAAAVTISLVVLALLTLSVGIRLLRSGEPVSHRIVVGARGCGPDCDRTMATQFARKLSALGFDAVAPPDREHALHAPRAVRDFAREHGARFAVMLVFSVEKSHPLDAEQGQRVDANATLYVMDSADGASPTPAHRLRSVEEGHNEHAALALLSRRFIEALFPVTASALLSSGPVEALLQRTGSMDQQAAAMAFKKRERDLRSRADAMRDYQLQCEANDELLASAKETRCVSSGCAEEYLVGLMPDGARAVVHDSSNDAVFTLEPSSTARSFMTSERLWLVGRGGERELLAEAANFYSRPDLSSDGSTLAFIERRHGRSRLYALRLGDRSRQLVATAHSPGHLSQPRLSADGGDALYFALDAPRGEASLIVRSTRSDAAPRQLLAHALDARWVTLSLEPERPPQVFVAALVPGTPDPARERARLSELELNQPHIEVLDPSHGSDLAPEKSALPEVWILDPTTSEVVARLDRPEHHIRALGEVHEGALLLSWHDTRCGFARYLPGEPIEWRATELCPKHIAVGAGGAYAHAMRDREGAVRQVVRIDAAQGRLQRLTHSAYDAQRPRPASDHATYAYERVMPRRYGEFQHVAVCFGE